MPEFDVDAERVDAFRLDEQYVFAHYFERDDAFEAIREYYDDEAYRFEVPVDEFDEVRAQLRDVYYDLAAVEDPEPYCVVKEKYTTHAAILRDSVANWERRGHLFFLMKDRKSVERALQRGATRVEATEFALGI